MLLFGYLGSFHCNVDCIFVAVGGDFVHVRTTIYIMSVRAITLIGLSLLMFIAGLIVHRILLRRIDIRDVLRKVAERCAQCINYMKSCIKKENDITTDEAEDLAPLLSGH